MVVNLPSVSDIDIICFSLSRWDAPISSPAVSLAKELSKSNRVFFIEHPYSLKDVISRGKLPLREPYRDGNVTVISPPITLPVNFISNQFIYSALSRVNNAILLKTLRLVIKEIGIRNYLFINFFDPFFLREIPADIRPLKFIYQCMDDISQVAYTGKHGVRLEKEIIRHADITLCTSRELTRLKSELSPRVYFHPNAADVELFKTAFEKKSGKDGRKVIGFIGSIEYRTDYDLLRKIAARHSDKLLMMIGPVDTDEKVDFPNVIFTGAKRLDELPGYLQTFDCCIIPYKVNTLTRSIYPLKINEYLAAGRPVVTTHFSEDIAGFADVAYIAESHEEFVGMIDQAIREDDLNRRYQRLAKASMNSWEHRVREFWTIVFSHLS